MKKHALTKFIASGLSVALMAGLLSGCRFGFASDPDDPNAVEAVEPIDTSVDTFEYDPSLSGTSITLLNSKAEIQTALVEMAEAYEEKSGVHVEVMPVTDGDSPYTKVVSLYNSGNPPTLSILDTTDVIALAEEKAEGGRPVRPALDCRGGGLHHPDQRQGVQLPPVYRGPRHHLPQGSDRGDPGRDL